MYICTIKKTPQNYFQHIEKCKYAVCVKTNGWVKNPFLRMKCILTAKDKREKKYIKNYKLSFGTI